MMSDDRFQNGRREQANANAKRRSFAFKPSIDAEHLESRCLMTGFHANSVSSYVLNHYLLTHPSIRNAVKANTPVFTTKHAPAFRKTETYNKGVADTQTLRGGSSVVVAMPDGNKFRISLEIADNAYGSGLTAQTGGTGNNVIPSSVVQPTGTVRAYAMPGDKIGLIVDGTNAQTQLTINPVAVAQRKGYAHSFAYGQAGRTHILNIGSINVTSGQIAGILGFHSANLEGPLVIGGSSTVDRLAFNSLQPGAAIAVGGTLNTLDIAQGVNLTSGAGIKVGGDLNLLNVGGDLSLSNGANLTVGRFLGLVPQPPKGTGTGSNYLSLNQSQVGSGTSYGVPSLSAYIQGNLVLSNGSAINVGSGIANSSITSAGASATPTVFLINGTILATTGLNIPNLDIGFNEFSTVTTDSSGKTTVDYHNLVFRTG